jgi:hypothetical protein
MMSTDNRRGLPRALPARVAARSNPADWGQDELMSLPEAAALFWPQGPLGVTSLRTAHRNGQLAVAQIAGKFLTTRRSIEEMAKTCLRLSNSGRTVSPTEKPANERPPRDSSLRTRIAAIVATP